MDLIEELMDDALFGLGQDSTYQGGRSGFLSSRHGSQFTQPY